MQNTTDQLMGLININEDLQQELSMKINKDSIVGVRLNHNVKDALFEGTNNLNCSPSDYIRDILYKNISKDFEDECLKYKVHI